MSLVEREALSDANEDYTGLYELVWRLNSLYPAKSPAEKLRLAREALKSLLDKGWIRIYKSYCDEQESPLSAAESNNLLESDEAWLPPSEGPAYYFFASKEGEEAYYESDAMGLEFPEAIQFVKQCDADDLDVYTISVFRTKNSRPEKPAVAERVFRQKEGEGWVDLRERRNAEGLEFIQAFADRNDLTFFVTVSGHY